MTALYDDALRPTGLRTTQFSILTRLNSVESITLTNLARLLVIDRTTLGRNLMPLEREGLLLTEKGEDKRERIVCLTSAGKEALGRAQPLWLAAHERFEQAFGTNEAEALRATMKQVVDAGLHLTEHLGGGN